MSILYCFTMPQPPKKKPHTKKCLEMGEADLLEVGELDFINTEASTLEIVETALGDDLFY